MKSDLLFDHEIYKAFEDTCYEELKQIEEGIAKEGRHIFSDNYDEKMHYIRCGRTQPAGEYSLRDRKIRKRIKLKYGLIAAILMIFATATVAAVEPIREKLGGIFYTVTLDDVEIRPVKTEQAMEKNEGIEKLVKKPTYIPKGYTLLEEDMRKEFDHLVMRWSDQKGDNLTYKQYNIAYTTSTVAADGTTPENVIINGNEARLVTDHVNNIGTLFYEMDGYVYMVSGKLPKKELIQVLENIQ